MQDLLNGRDSGNSNSYDLLDEPTDNKKLLFGVFAVVIVAVLGFTLYYFTIKAPQQKAEETRQAVLSTPLLQPFGILKEIPEDTGGLQIPNQDKQVFETIESKPEASTAKTGETAETDETQEPQATTLPAPEEPQTPEPSQPSPKPSQVTETAETAEAETSAEVPETQESGQLQIEIPSSTPEAPQETSQEATPEPSPETPSETPSVAEAPSETAAIETPEQTSGGKLEIQIPEPSPQPSQPSQPSPEPTEITQASPEPSPEATPTEGGDFSTQLAALESQSSAELVRDDLLKRFPEVLEGDKLLVEAGETSDGREIFRVQMISLSLKEAQSVCATLQQNGLDCFVKKGR